MKLNKITIEQLRAIGASKLLDYNGKMIIADHIAQEYLFEEPCRIDAITILIVIRGHLDYVVNLEHNEVKDSSILINMPENIIQFKGSENLDAYAVLISSELIKSMHYDIFQRASNYLPMKQHYHANVPLERLATLTPFYELLKTCIAQPMQETDEIVKSLLQSFLLNMIGMVREYQQLQNEPEQRPAKATSQLFERFMEMLQKYHHSERTVQFYADKLCVTPKYLSMVVKDYSGRNPLDWICEYVIAEAKSLLYYSQLPAQEVAFRLNFPSQSAFGKFFKQKTGYSPLQYAKHADN